jgi:hypothetical protein
MMCNFDEVVLRSVMRVRPEVRQGRGWQVLPCYLMPRPHQSLQLYSISFDRVRASFAGARGAAAACGVGIRNGLCLFICSL